MKTMLNVAAVAAAMCLTGAFAHAQAPSPASPTPVEYAFIGQTYLGNQFQIDSGRLGETRAADPAVGDYAKLMDTSHVEVEKNLVTLLQRKGWVQPPTSLLEGAYANLVSMLGAEHGAAFDRDYITGQVDYQKVNDALYRWEIQNGTDADLKAFARETLPKIDDHLQQALKLNGATN